MMTMRLLLNLAISSADESRMGHRKADPRAAGES
jgi:hypothetical protein